MKATVSNTQLFHDLKSMDRDNFSYEGAKALMDYLSDMEDDLGVEFDYDPIAICCQYCEYADIEEIQNDYGDEYETIDDVRECTTVIEHLNGFIIELF